jgi:hypothetical protein
MFGIKKFLKGLKIVPKTTLESDVKGELEVEDSSGKINYHNGSTRSPIVTEAHSATLTNKTIDADDNTIVDLELDNLKSGVLNTSTTLTGAANTNIPSTLAVKTYIDNGLSAQNEADEITYDNTSSGLTAVNVQAAIDEIDVDIDDLNTLSGVAKNEVDLGTFTGVTIPDDSTIKQALQALETDLETRALDSDLDNHINDVTDAHDASAISVVPTGNLASSDVQSALVELQGDADAANTHISASTNVHGLSGGAAVVGTTSTQTLTNKTITGANIQTPVRSDVKQDTKANLVTYATTASNGQLVFATDTKELLQVIDGVLEAVGAGGGIGGVDILFVQDFESAALSDFTQTGLVLSDTNPLKGTVSARLTHDSVSNRSFKQIVAVDEKFRNRNITLKLNIKSAANAGNVTLTVRDETNAVNLVSSEQLPISNAVGGAIGIVTFNMPSTCLSFSYEVIALPQVGSPVTIVDDIIAELSISSLLTTSVTIPTKDGEVVGSKYAEVAGTVALSGTIPKDNTIPQISEGTQFLSLSYTPKRMGNRIRIRANGYIQENANTGDSVTMAIFRNSEVDALASATSIFADGNIQQGPLVVTKEMTVSSLASISFTVRGGCDFGASTLNRVSTNGVPHTYGGVITSSITVEEIQVNDYNEATEIPLAQSVIVQEADSVVSLQAANGYGSSGTAIRRFSTIRDIKGSDIEYVDSPVNGASFTIKKEGIYSIH